jgi:hypothetical protein
MRWTRVGRRVTVAWVAMALAGCAAQSPHGPQPGPTTTLTAPASFDPLVRYASFPDPLGGATEWGITTAANTIQLYYHYGDKTGGTIDVDLVSAGHGIKSFGSSDFAVDDPPRNLPQGQDVEPIDGRPATWSEGDGPAILQWEYAPGAWADVRLYKITGDARAIARTVAESVVYGVGEPLLLPYDRPAVPSAFSPGEVRIEHFDDSWSVHVCYAFDGKGRRVVDDTWPLVVDVDDVFIPNVGHGPEIDGYPGWLTENPDGSARLEVEDVGGLNLTIDSNSSKAIAAIPGGLVGVFEALHLRTDPATWS